MRVAGNNRLSGRFTSRLSRTREQDIFAPGGDERAGRVGPASWLGGRDISHEEEALCDRKPTPHLIYSIGTGMFSHFG